MSQYKPCISAIVIFLICFTVKICHASDVRTITRTSYETQVLTQYINFFEDLKKQMKKHKDVLDIAIYGSRASRKNLTASMQPPHITIGYGNDAYSDLDTYMVVNNYEKYCNCDWVENYFNSKLCYVKVYKPSICSVKFMKDDIIVSIAVYQQKFDHKKMESYYINKFFILAIEVQQLIIRQILEPRKKYDIESKLLEMLYILENKRNVYDDRYYNMKIDIIKRKKQQESLDRLIKDMLEIKLPFMSSQEKLEQLDEVAFALKYLEKIKQSSKLATRQPQQN